jgi:hypothetical protein
MAMAKILQFARPDTDRRRKAGDIPAEIVIFPGIRVEYHDVPPHPAGSGGSRRGRRSPAKRSLTA